MEVSMRLLPYASFVVFSSWIAFTLPSFADPPDHAPAHGYRAKHGEIHRHSSGVELKYDSGLGLYVALGFPDVFYADGKFYTQREGHWEVSLRADRDWTVAVAGSVPLNVNKIKFQDNASGKKGGKHK